MIAKRAVEIGRMENMHIEINAAEAIAESCGNDIRQVLNCIQMWSNNNTNKNNKNMTYKDLKERQNDINKDESLRLNIFDSTKMIIEGPKGLGNDDIPLHVANKSLFDRTNAYFTVSLTLRERVFIENNMHACIFYLSPIHISCFQWFSPH